MLSMMLLPAGRSIAAVILCAAVVAAGCSTSPETSESDADVPVAGVDATGGADGTQNPEPDSDPAPRAFAAGDTILIELTMQASEDDGRSTAFYSGYRPTLEFAGGVATTCTINLDGISQFEPGETHTVAAECKDDVTVEPDAVEVDVIEGGAVRGSGMVLLDGQ
jgi:hypothetical protein